MTEPIPFKLTYGTTQSGYFAHFSQDTVRC